MFYQVTAGKSGGEPAYGIIGHRVPVQIIDKKAEARLLLHPLQMAYQCCLGKVMTEQGRENDVGRLIKMYLPVVGCEETCIDVVQALFCYCNAIRVVINANEMGGYTATPAPARDGGKIVAATTADFADDQVAFVMHKRPNAPQRDGVTTQPGIDDI